MINARRQEGAPWMIHADERRLSDHNGTLLASVVRMSAPGNVRKQASRMPQTPLPGRLCRPRARKKGVRPAYELPCMLSRPGPEPRDLVASRQKRVLRALRLA